METRYAYVARLLTEAIAGGRHPIGSVLPNEFELAEQFAVSRSTVRAAMRELQASGLVSRKRNAGTRVEALTPQRSGGGFTQALESIEAVQRFGVETERHVQRVAEVVADDALARDLGCQPGRRWLRISSLRMIPGDATKTPICWTDVHIDDAFAREVRSRMEDHRDIFGTLVEKISGRRFSEIRQDIRAVGVSHDMAVPLKATPGAHALAIRRQYLFSSNEMAEVSLSIHPADRYSYTTRLMRKDSERE
ncbi:GntR family transcriptional regulator [Bradyrhizobium sp. Leo121]|uniref:GntR family transcriptional regulator n=1 Tax=Bradyrhizobium sp. Leo121 TaxID=1571195 RepID=UPI0010291053|nr:GntR family transcriptional regulator [Bradyrhizobium sp. Leo121]RZN35812.1 GntR family transcriptional regulator [Bradyrhizobium sp. Leo121]